MCGSRWGITGGRRSDACGSGGDRPGRVCAAGAPYPLRNSKKHNQGVHLAEEIATLDVLSAGPLPGPGAAESCDGQEDCEGDAELGKGEYVGLLV